LLGISSSVVYGGRLAVPSVGGAEFVGVPPALSLSSTRHGRVNNALGKFPKIAQVY